MPFVPAPVLHGEAGKQAEALSRPRGPGDDGRAVAERVRSDNTIELGRTGMGSAEDGEGGTDFFVPRAP